VTGKTVVLFELEIGGTHLEIGLEIALTQAMAGNTVHYFLIPPRVLEPSPYEHYPQWIIPPLQLAIRVKHCLQGRTHHLRLVKKASRKAKKGGLDFHAEIIKSLPLSSNLANDFDPPDSLKELVELNPRGTAMGVYLASSLITISQNSQVVPSEHGSLMKELVRKFDTTYSFAADAIARIRPDVVALYNGRFADSGGLVAAAERFRVEVFFHELEGYSGERYFFEPWRPHHWRKKAEVARIMWEELDFTAQQQAIVAGKKLLADSRAAGGFINSFHRQSADRTLLKSAKAKKLLVYYSTSSDEIASVPDVTERSVYADQRVAILDLAERCRELGIDFLVRVHPNTAKKSKADRDLWDVDLGGLIGMEHVIRSTDTLNSYDLLNRADVVATWWSSMGLEAVGHGVPTISMCDNIHLMAGADMLRVGHPRELTKKILEALSYVPNKESVTPYLYFLSHAGEKFVLFDSGTGGFWGIRPSFWSYLQDKRLLRK